MPRAIIERRHRHTQSIASNTWNIVHNLNVVSPVVDVWVREVPGAPLVNSDAHTVHFVDASTVTVSFGFLKEGTALIT